MEAGKDTPPAFAGEEDCLVLDFRFPFFSNGSPVGAPASATGGGGKTGGGSDGGNDGGGTLARAGGGGGGSVGFGE